MTEYPAVAELVPHEHPMMLLERVLSADAESIACEVVVRDDELFAHEGSVPAWLGIEYMAQTVAAFAGWQSWSRGEPARQIGFLLGTRRFETSLPELPCGAALRIDARRVVQADSGMAAFDCRVTGETIVQTARLSVYQPGPGQPLTQGARA